MNTIRNRTTTKVFLVTYCTLGYTNLALHFANYFQGIIGMPIEYAFQTVSLVIFILTLLSLRKANENSEVVSVTMGIAMAVTIFEAIVMTAMPGSSDALLNVVLAIICIKYFLDIFLYGSLANTLRAKVCWNVFNAVIILSLFSAFFEEKAIFILMALFSLRALFAIYLVLKRDSSFNRGPSANVGKIVKGATALVVVMAVVLFAILIGKSGKKDAQSQELIFDCTGIAWDHKGHFVDQSGNVVITIDPVVYEKKSAACSIMNNYLDLVYGNYDSRIDNDWVKLVVALVGDRDYHYDAKVRWQGLRAIKYEVCQYNNRYFNNGIAVFYSDVKGAYGLINEDGEVVFEPKILSILSYKATDIEVIPVRFKLSGDFNIIDKNGNCLLDLTTGWRTVDIDEDNKLIVVNSNRGTCSIVRFDGTIITDDLTCKGYDADCGDIIVLQYADYIIVKDLKGKTLLHSNLYDGFYGYALNDGQVKYLLVKQKSDSRWVLVDTWGKKQTEKSFYSVRSIEMEDVPFAICDGYTSPDFTVLFFDGRVLETEYFYEDYDKANNRFKVSMKDETGIKVYNFMDFEGDLVSEEWTVE